MTSFHKSVSTAKKDQEEKKNTAVAKLEQFLLERRGARQPVDDLEEFERELHSLFATAEAEVVGHEVNRFDIDLPFVTVDGIVHQRVLRCEDTYFCASGPVTSALGKTDPGVLAMNDPWTEHDREHVITGGTKGAVSCCGV